MSSSLMSSINKAKSAIHPSHNNFINTVLFAHLTKLNINQTAIVLYARVACFDIDVF